MAFFQTETLWLNQLADGVGALILDVPDRSVNVLSRRVLVDLDSALDRVAAEPSFRLLVIRSGKPGTFIAGADVQELANLRGPDEAAQVSEQGQRVFEKLAALPIPTAAIIGGACLGGGLELALACDYRVVLDGARTQLGLPEVELGLLPAWGGTQRLPRVIGLERAMLIILGGKRLGAADAVRWGLADEITSEKEEEPPLCLAQPVKRPKGGLPLRTWRQRLLESTGLGRWLLFRGTERLLRRRVPDDMPAPWEALRAVRTGLKHGVAAGLAFERTTAAKLAATSACRNLMNVFLRREEARRPWQKPRPESPPIRRVGVVGAGTMGAGIVQLAVLRGCDVVIREPTETALATAILRILGLVHKAVEAGLLSTAEVPKLLANVHGTTAWKGFADLDLCLEAVVEDPKRKRSVFKEMEKHTSASTMLATNTSSLRVAPLSEDLQYPGRVAGLHFFNPVHKMPLVEIVRTPATKQDVLDSLAEWVVSLGKTPVFVKDSPGFLVNRILAPYFHEALLLVSEGLRVRLVDGAMRRFGMPMGPLEVLDAVGLDVAADIAESLQPIFAGRFPPSTALAQLREHGWLGEKSGAGFYRYRRRRATEHHEAMALLRGQGGAPQLEAASPDDLMAAARERLVGLMVNEAARCLGEQVADSAATIDLAMVLGSGWAPHRGGPLRYAEERGYAALVESLSALANRLGPRLEPCAELRRLASR